jgi:hypothetical protein
LQAWTNERSSSKPRPAGDFIFSTIINSINASHRLININQSAHCDH